MVPSTYMSFTRGLKLSNDSLASENGKQVQVRCPLQDKTTSIRSLWMVCSQTAFSRVIVVIH